MAVPIAATCTPATCARRAKTSSGSIALPLGARLRSSARERAALAWAESLTLVSATHAPDDVYQAARAEFSDKELVDLTFAVALMNAWNRVAVGFGQGPVQRKAKAAAA